MNKHFTIILAGPNSAGKTTFALTLLETLPVLQHVTGDKFRDFLKNTIPYYVDVDFSLDDPATRSANNLAKNYIAELTKELVSNNKSVLVDATNLRSQTRKFRIEEVKKIQPNTKTIIVGFDIPASLLRERLTNRDRSSQKAQWLKNYDSYIEKTYEFPGQTEADFVFINDGTNSVEIINKIQDIILCN
jgi:adenylate kinase family enzyme